MDFHTVEVSVGTEWENIVVPSDTVFCWQGLDLSHSVLEYNSSEAFDQCVISDSTLQLIAQAVIDTSQSRYFCLKEHSAIPASVIHFAIYDGGRVETFKDIYTCAEETIGAIEDLVRRGYGDDAVGVSKEAYKTILRRMDERQKEARISQINVAKKKLEKDKQAVESDWLLKAKLGR
jgi:hypothetical protein